MRKSPEELDLTAKPWLDFSAYQVYTVHVAPVVNMPPIVSMYAPSTANAGEDVTYVAEAEDQDCNGNSIVKYEWDWNNDGVYEDSGPSLDTMHHTFLTGGAHFIQVRVTDDEGSTATLDKPWEVDVATEFEVTFPDANLDSLIRQIINKPGEPIMKSDLDTITQVAGYNDGISNLEGMEYVWNPTVVTFWINNIKDIGPLRNMTKLTSLNIQHNNGISDISALSG